eukprot:356348-Chlamydomonas_euryale.AAC.5
MLLVSDDIPSTNISSNAAKSARAVHSYDLQHQSFKVRSHRKGRDHRQATGKAVLQVSHTRAPWQRSAAGKSRSASPRPVHVCTHLKGRDRRRAARKGSFGCPACTLAACRRIAQPERRLADIDKAARTPADNITVSVSGLECWSEQRVVAMEQPYMRRELCGTPRYMLSACTRSWK